MTAGWILKIFLSGKKEIDLGFLHWIITAFIDTYKISQKKIFRINSIEGIGKVWRPLHN